MNAELFPLLVATSVALAVLGVGGLAYALFIKTQRKILRQRRFKRLDSILISGIGTVQEKDELDFSEKVVLFFTGRLPEISLDTSVSETESEDRLLLNRAGFRGLRALVVFYALRLLAVVVTVVGFAAFEMLKGSMENLLGGVALTIVAILAPRYILRFLAQRRMKLLEDELPIFVDFLRMVHSVGINIEQDIIMFAEEPRLGLPVLAGEMAAVNLSIRSGRSRTDALQLMAQQLDVDNISDLVALLCHTDHYGAGLQEPLRQFSQRLAENKRFQMQEYVGKLAARMVIVMVLFLLPGLLVITAGPGFLAVLRALSNTT